MFNDLLNETKGFKYQITVKCLLKKYKLTREIEFRPLSGRSYIDLPIELKIPRKGLINIQNKDQKCFFWCHVRHINPSKEHPERILKNDKKKLLKNLIMMELSFMCKKKILTRLK